MSKHDDKIQQLLVEIQKKKDTIGTKPKASWRTNGILKFDDGTHLNINTVSTLDKCVDAVAFILKKQGARKAAAALLDVPYEDDTHEDYLEDFKLRARILKWDGEKKKLDVLEKKLKDLRSEDAKTADALSDIMQELQ